MTGLIYADLLNCAVVTLISIFLLILCINDKYKKTKTSLSIIFSIFFILQATSLLTIMTDINYHFLVNLLDITTFIAMFKTNIFREYILMALGIIIIVIFILYFIHKKVKITNKFIKYAIISICSIFLLTPFSLLNRFTKVIFNIAHNPEYRKSYQTTFKEITQIDFVDRNNLITKLPEKPKNLVLIFLESTEQNFMNEQEFGKLLGAIKSLTEEGEYFYNIEEIEGSNWTLAGMHTAMCGSPSIYNIRRNKLFKTVTVSNLICFSDVLKKANYNQVYLGGVFKTFAGKSFFLEMHGYDKIYGDKEVFAEVSIKDEDKWGWGAKDLDLLTLAKAKYKELSEQNQPFNLTIITVGGHAPNGIYDKRCKNSTDNGVLNAIECTNDLIKDFIDFLKTQPKYKDTIVVILPDHLMMTSNLTNKLSKIEGGRKLFTIILNSGKIEKYDNKILYTDLAEIMLNRLNIQHNAKFIMNNYNNETTKTRIEFLNNNLNKIKNFNQKTIMQD